MQRIQALNPGLKNPHLILGGARSGKSTHAESLMARLAPPYVYVATAQALDEEMQDRVLRHRERRGAAWETIECPFELVGVLQRLQPESRPVLVDCLTLWLTNLLLNRSPAAAEEQVAALCAFLEEVRYPLIMVSNEVGFGIVPDNALARQFRDFAGFSNQRIAARCEAVTLVAAGIPLTLK